MLAPLLLSPSHQPFVLYPFLFLRLLLLFQSSVRHPDNHRRIRNGRDTRLLRLNRNVRSYARDWLVLYFREAFPFLAKARPNGHVDRGRGKKSADLESCKNQFTMCQRECPRHTGCADILFTRLLAWPIMFLISRLRSAGIEATFDADRSFYSRSRPRNSRQ